MSSGPQNLSKPWLVTGATGMLGGAFVNKWAHESVAIVRRNALLPCETIEGFLDEPSSIAAIIKKVRPSVCFHFAACTNLAYCEQNPGYADKINVVASSAIAKACADTGTRVVYMCTDSIFDGKKGNYSEADATTPLNSYASSKLRGEQVILASSERNISIRGNIIGTERQHISSMKLYDWAVENLKNQESITGFADVIFNPLGVDTLSEFLGQIVQLDLPGGCWHLGTKNPVSKDQFIRLVAKSNGLSDACITRGLQADLNLQPARPLNTSLQTVKIESAGISMPTIESELDLLTKTHEQP
jgi:dTDP-4-dehydrorhamnose reductase